MRLATLLLTLSSSAALVQPGPQDMWRVGRMPADELPAIRERIKRPPYSNWWAGVSGSSDMVAQAFCWRVTGDEAKASAVRQRLLRCNPTGYHCCCGMADALQGVAEAYDLIYDYPRLTETDHRVIRAKIACACERLYLSALESGPGEHPGNQRTRGICALGTAALVLSGYQDAAHTPQQWLQRALDGIHDDANLEFWRDDGMFIEGPGYSSFTLSVMLPFARYYHQCTGKWLFDDPRLRNALLYTVYVTQPDGMCTAMGTTNMGNVVDSLRLCVGAGNPADQAFFRWALQEWGSSGGGVREICLFDDAVRPSVAGFPTSRFFPVSQEASLRSAWSRKAVALWLKGKDPWLARTYDVYSHDDVGSFVIHAYGELLAVDAGYDHWVSRDLYPAELHNTLLVDGKGPVSETAGVLRNVVDSGYLQAGEIESEYAGVKHRRTFLLVDGEYVIISDDIRAQAEHDYAWQIHTPVSRATGQVRVEGNRATWTGFDPRTDSVGGVTMQAVWAGPIDVEPMGTSRWQPWSPDPKTGSYDNWAIVARQRGTNVRYLTVLLPRPTILPPARIEEVPVEGGLCLTVRQGMVRDVIMVSDGGTVVFGALKSDASVAVLRDADGSPAWAYVSGPGGIYRSNKTLLRLSDAGAAAVRLSGWDHPPRVHVAGPADMTCTADYMNLRGDSAVSASGQPVATLARPPLQARSFVLPQAIAGPACLLIVPAGTAPPQDASPPEVAGVWIDDQPAEAADVVDLGRVPAPPKALRVRFRDPDSGLDDYSADAALDGLRRSRWTPIRAQEDRKEGAVELALDGLAEPVDHEVVVSVGDNAWATNRTQFTLRFSMRPLLGNGGFEQAGGWSYGAWSSNAETKYEIRPVADHPHSGQRCLMMRGIGGALNMVASQAAPLVRGKTYVLRGCFRGDVQAKASLCSQAGTGQYIFSSPIGPSQDWTPFTWGFALENPSSPLIVALRLSSVGTVYFDDLELAESTGKADR
jgi:hypothetical protein